MFYCVLEYCDVFGPNSNLGSRTQIAHMTSGFDNSFRVAGGPAVERLSAKSLSVDTGHKALFPVSHVIYPITKGTGLTQPAKK